MAAGEVSVEAGVDDLEGEAEDVETKVRQTR